MKFSWGKVRNRTFDVLGRAVCEEFVRDDDGVGPSACFLDEIGPRASNLWILASEE